MRLPFQAVALKTVPERFRESRRPGESARASPSQIVLGQVLRNEQGAGARERVETRAGERVRLFPV